MKHFFNIKPAETYRYERAGFWVIVFLEYVIMAASAAFSWGYFSGFLKFTQISESMSFGLAVALTVLQSVVIGIMLDQLVHSYVFDRWESRHNYIGAACLALMIWDVYANSQGVPELAEMTMKRSAFTTPPYPAAADYDRTVSELNELKKHKWKGVSVHNAQNNADFAALEKKKAFHENQQTVLLVQAQGRYEAGLEDDKKIMASAISSMRWANLALYVLAIILLLAKENIKKDLAKGKIQVPIEDEEDEDLGNLRVTPTGKVYDQTGKQFGPSNYGATGQVNVGGYGSFTQQAQQTQQPQQQQAQQGKTVLQHVATEYAGWDPATLKSALSRLKSVKSVYAGRAKGKPENNHNVVKLNEIEARISAIDSELQQPQQPTTVG